MPLPPLPALPAQLAERYRVLRVLGSGAFGQVLAAEDMKLGREVAIKLLHATAAEDPGTRARFVREAKAMARIRSPRVAEVHEFGEVEGLPFLICSYIPGQDLEAHLASQGGRLPVDEALRLMRQILEGLEAAHEGGVLHRDLKPANVLLDSLGDAVLVDFGLARLEDESKLTATGTVLGTPIYMAPEQLQGGEPQPHWDLWAAALIACEMFTGQLPFAVTTLEEVLEAKYRQILLREHMASVDLPTAFLLRLQNCVDLDATKRPLQARDVIESMDPTSESLAMEALASSATIRVDTPTVDDGLVLPESRTVPTGKSNQGRRGKTYFFLALGLMVCGLGGWMAGTKSAPPPPPPPRGETLIQRGHEVLNHPAVRSALSLTSQDLKSSNSAAVLDQYKEGRRAFAEKMVPVSEELSLFTKIPDDGVPVLNQLYLAERLFSLGEVGLPPVYDAGFSPDLRGRLRAEFPAAAVDWLGGPRGLVPEYEAFRSDHRKLEKNGARWTALFFPPSDARQRKPHQFSLTMQNLHGDAFEGAGYDLPPTFQDVGAEVAGAGWLPDGKELWSFDLKDFVGDLILTIVVWDWPGSVPVKFEVVGEVEERHGESVHMAETRMPLVSRVEHPRSGEETCFGVMVRFPRRSLRGKPRKVELTAWGLEPLGNPSRTVSIRSVHQRISGPLPAELQ